MHEALSGDADRLLERPRWEEIPAAYFERFSNVWCQGDFCELTPHGGMIIHGRSDAVLNPGGVRIGTAEIYRQVEKLPEVMESLVIGQDWDNDVRVVLFVHLRDGATLDAALVDRIKRQIRDNTTPRHVPAKIVAITDIPRTRSGKIVELAVRNVINGQPVKNVEALADPGALEQFRNRPELQDLTRALAPSGARYQPPFPPRRFCGWARWDTIRCGAVLLER